MGAEKRVEEQEDVLDHRSSPQTGAPTDRVIEVEVGTGWRSGAQSGLSVSWS